MIDWKRRFRKITAAAAAAMMGLQILPLFPTMEVSASQSAVAIYDKDFTLVGEGGKDMLAVAKVQTPELGDEEYPSSSSVAAYYSSSLWSAEFISDCAILAGQEDAIPWSGNPQYLYENIIAAGGKRVTSPQPGDLIFHYCDDYEMYVDVAVFEENDGLFDHWVGLNRMSTTRIETGPIVTYYHYYVVGESGASAYLYSQFSHDYTHCTGQGLTSHYVRPAYDKPATLSSISVSSKPTTTTYFVGDTLDTTGLKLKATYSDGSTKTITSGYKVSYDFSSAGTKTVTVTYGGKSTTFTCTVNAITLSSIAVATKPNTLIYEDGAAINTTGLTLTATYSDGSTKTISSGYTTSYDFSSAGSKKVTVTYGGKTATVNVTVQDLFEGSGTAADPYLIGTAADLKAMADAVNNINANGCYGFAYYQQTEDIDLSSYSNWMPIGCFYPDSTSTTANNWAAFRGNYNGGYCKITGLNISNTRNYSGLFGRLTQATVRNLSVNGTVSGVNCVGGIAGEMGYGGKVECCDFTGTVSGTTLIGSIIGKIHAGGEISSCYANAEVTASNGMAGGIAGYILVGNHANSVDCLVKDCYFVGDVTGTQEGGIAGSTSIGTTKENTITFTNNSYLQTVASGGVDSTLTDGCSGLHYSTLKQNPAWLGENYVAAEGDQNDGYPVFYWQMNAPFAGSGTEEDPYQISNKEELEKMRDLMNNTVLNPMFTYAYYIQTADIDLENEVWMPIGCFYEDDTSTTISNYAIFRGHYDGNCHKITGLNVSNTRYYSGLFGRVTRGTILNLSVSGSVSGTNCVGGIVGELGYGGLIQNCDFTGTVSGTTLVGAILGKAHGGCTISSCYANAEISASDGMAGGLVGQILVGQHKNSADGLVENSYFAGTVTGTQSGGIAGAATIDTVSTNTITLTNNYYLTTSADGAVDGAAADGVTMVGSNKLMTIAPDLGSPFVDNPYTTLNDGFPVFEWQLDTTGDVNLDGTVSVLDIVALQKYLLAQQDFTEENFANADMNADGSVNIFDLAALKQYLLAL